MNTLQINAHVKYIEFLMSVFDSAESSTTIADIRKDFAEKFGTEMPHMLNQNFGIVRLVPLLMIREQLKNEGRKYDRRISIIRHAVAHGNFDISETGYEFKSDIGNCKMTYTEFNEFLWWVENEFYLSR